MWRLNGVDFDGCNGDYLLEAKSSYSNFIDANGEFKSWFTGRTALTNQLIRQKAASEGNPIKWCFSDELTLTACSSLFEKYGLLDGNITLAVCPMP